MQSLCESTAVKNRLCVVPESALITVKFIVKTIQLTRTGIAFQNLVLDRHDFN